MTVVDLNPDNLASSLENGSAVVKFYAEWCGHCKNFKEPFEAMALQNPDVQFFGFDMDSHREKLDARYEKLSNFVDSYPTVLGFRLSKAGQVEAIQLTTGGRDEESIKTLADATRKPE